MNLQFTPFPELNSGILLLRELRHSDIHELHQLRSSDLVNRYIGRPKARELSETKAFIDKIQSAVKNNESIYWVIEYGDGKLIGTICLWNIDSEKSECEIGYELNPAFQGKGIMQSAIKPVINYGFNMMRAKNILAYTHRDNAKSSALLEKNNFILQANSLSSGGNEIIYTLSSAIE